MAITTQDGLIAAMAAGTASPFLKPSITTTAGRPYATFRMLGNPIGGSNPSSTGAALDYTTQGALTIPAPSNTTYLFTWAVAAQQLGTMLLYDRLVETGGLSGTVTTAQTVNSASLPSRNTSGVGCELWFECYADLGTSASATVTASYTNQSGASGKTATLSGGIPASTKAFTTLRFTLAAGDTGIQSVQSVTSTTSTTTAGNFGIVIRQFVGSGVMNGTSAASTGFLRNYAQLGLPALNSGACLEQIFISAATSSGQVSGNIRTGQG